METVLSPRSCRTRSPGLSSSLPLASIPFFQGGFHTNTRSRVNLSPTDIRLRGIRLGVAVCGGDDEVNLFCHYFSESENIGLLWAKVRMFCIESTDVCLKEIRCF